MDFNVRTSVRQLGRGDPEKEAIAYEVQFIIYDNASGEDISPLAFARMYGEETPEAKKLIAEIKSAAAQYFLSQNRRPNNNDRLEAEPMILIRDFVHARAEVEVGWFEK